MLLTTPRRSRKRSTTPQNTLRVLSRALVREREVDVEVEADDYDIELDLGEDVNRVPIEPEVETEPVEREEPIDESIDVPMDMPIDQTPGNSPRLSPGFSPVAANEGLIETPPRSILSDPSSLKTPTRHHADIAIPQALAPENTFLQINESLIEDKKRITSKTTKPTKVSKIHNVKAIKQLCRDTVKKQLNEDSIPVLLETLEIFLDQLAMDLQAYSNHSNKSMINIKSVYLLFKRQRLINSMEDFLKLIEANLSLENILEIRRNLNKT